MHQSPQRQPAGRRDRQADVELADALAERHSQRGNQPKARKFPLRDENTRGDARWDKQPPGR